MKSIMTGMALAISMVFPAAAQDCGRWVPCGVDNHLTVEETRGYVYGNRGSVEPWVKVEARKKPPVKVLPAPPIMLGRGAGPEAEQVGIVEAIIADEIAMRGNDPDQPVVDMGDAKIINRDPFDVMQVVIGEK